MINQTIQGRLSKLRSKMTALGIDYYLIPTADFHNSEYVAPYFQTRSYFSGFTGSNGTLVVGQNEAGLWTDGRYFIQAEKELSGTGVDLYRESEEGVPTVTEWLADRFGRAAGAADQSAPDSPGSGTDRYKNAKEAESESGCAGQNAIKAESKSGCAGKNAIKAESESGCAGQNAKEAEPESGCAGKNEIKAESESGCAGQNAKEAEPESGCAGQKEHQPALAFDGRCVNVSSFRNMQRKLSGMNIRFVTEIDPAEEIWDDRPARPAYQAYVLAEEYAGETARSKLERLREKMRSAGASVYVENKLDNLMWLFNLRGRDVECTPVALCFGVITMDRQILFIQESAVTKEVRLYAGEIGLELRSYEKIFDFLENPELYKNAVEAVRRRKGSREEYACSPANDPDAYGCGILFSPASLSVRLYQALRKGRDAAFGGRISDPAVGSGISARNDIEKRSPVEDFKAVKNETELRNIRACYLEDSAAVCRFLYWIHRHVQEGTIQTLTEIDAERKMDSLRKEILDFKELSFKTISAYGPNAAMMHYSAKEDDCAQLKPEGMLLVDCGGQYLRGTTDVTRTVALGPVTGEMRRHYTLTAVGNLQLMDAVFLHGCTGRNVDILARQPLWRIMVDYKCGTGHGIGYLLSVHEGPQNIRWKFAEGAPEAVLEPGMIVSDEPGVYLEGRYGIRIETILEVAEAVKNSDGRFLCFHPLTLVPLDPELIDPEYLTPQTRVVLNSYHQRVFEEVGPLLTDEERKWLRAQTRPI